MENEFDYNAAVEELEKLASAVEQPGVPLPDVERSIRRADELIRACRDYLMGARTRLDEMQKD